MAAILGLGFSAAGARDDGDGTYRSAQLQWLFGPSNAAQPATSAPAAGDTERRTRRARPGARYYYVQSRDIFGNPGPVYRVYAVEKQKRRRVARERDDTYDRTRARAAEQLRKAAAPPPTKGPLLLAISLNKQHLTLYDQGVAVADSRISSGRPGHETPTGLFSVIQKQWWHRSNLYSDAPMPFMQRLTWSGIALHAGYVPNYPASHGCVRVPDEFAIRLWNTTDVGVRVVITNGEVAPVEISNPHLFVPKPRTKPETPGAPPMVMRAPATDAHADVLDGTPAPLARQGQFSLRVPVTAEALDRAASEQGLDFLARVSEEKSDSAPAAESPADDSPAPAAVDESANGRSRYQVGEGVAAAPPAAANDDDDDTGTVSIVRPGRPVEIVNVGPRRRRPSDTIQKLNEIDRPDRTTAAAAAEPPSRPFDVVAPPDVDENGVAGLSIVRGDEVADLEILSVEKVSPGETALAQRAPQESPVLLASVNAFAAVSPRRTGQAEPPADTPSPLPSVPSMAPSQPPQPLARPLRPGPVSVFVSRRERRVFVRKGFEPLFDAPVTIRDPGQSLGTHLFMAVAADPAAGTARWIALSIPTERMRVRSEGRHRRRSVDYVSTVPVSAAQALDRIEIPPDVVARISDLMSAGATLIVSDEGLGRETGRETDFTVLTR